MMSTLSVIMPGEDRKHYPGGTVMMSQTEVLRRRRQIQRRIQQVLTERRINASQTESAERRSEPAAR
jgi:hypothetical protein